MVWHFAAVKYSSWLIPHPSKLSAATEKEVGGGRMKFWNFSNYTKDLHMSKRQRESLNTAHRLVLSVSKQETAVLTSLASS